MILDPVTDSGACDAAVTRISDRDFTLFQKLILREAGIFLAPGKKTLLVGRLSRRLRELGMSSFRQYYEVVADGGDPDELTRMLDRICTNETSFFREPRHFDFLREDLFPRWSEQAAAGLRRKEIRIWSAACSTGEEPYSLAMVLLDAFHSSQGWTVDILATDLSTRALAQAQAGVWSVGRATGIPPRYLKRFMLRGINDQHGKMKARDEIRSVIQFARLNLNDERYAVTGRFDLVFCRNVLIYFDDEGKRTVVRRLMSHLSPDGYLFVGHAESLLGNGMSLRSVIPTVYTLADPQGERRVSAA